jgi:Sarcoglycan complex subunit protein
VWSADQDLLLRSLNGSIHLIGALGVTLDVQNMPLVTSEGSTQQYKLCVCKDKGRLYRVKMPASCLGFVGSDNPCADK